MVIDIVTEEAQHKKLHPHKFTMWVAIASMIMMFAGLTSAFIIKSNLTGWRTIQLPKIFILSTILIIASSVALYLSLRAFRSREMVQYRLLLLTTFLLGIAFIVCQVLGFSALWAQNVRFKGASGAGQFLYAIAGLHILHVLGGIIAILYMLVKGLWGKTKRYSAVPLEVVSTYWHFVDILWIYLIIFFLIVGS